VGLIVPTLEQAEIERAKQKATDRLDRSLRGSLLFTGPAPATPPAFMRVKANGLATAQGVSHAIARPAHAQLWQFHSQLEGFGVEPRLRQPSLADSGTVTVIFLQKIFEDLSFGNPKIDYLRQTVSFPRRPGLFGHRD
jgi:hypothetical protein